MHHVFLCLSSFAPEPWPCFKMLQCLLNAERMWECIKTVKKKKSHVGNRGCWWCVWWFLPSMMGSWLLLLWLACLLCMQRWLNGPIRSTEQWSDGLENNQAGKVLSRSPQLEMWVYHSGLKAGRMRQMPVGVLFNSVLTETGSGWYLFIFFYYTPPTISIGCSKRQKEDRLAVTVS